MSVEPEQMDFTSLLENKEAVWSDAETKLMHNGNNSVLVPLDFGNIYQRTSTNGVTRLGQLNYLFMYRDSSAQIQTEWVALYPDSAWIKGDRAQYTGRLLVKDWNGTVKKGFIYHGDGSVADLSSLGQTLDNATSQIQKQANINPSNVMAGAGTGTACFRIELWVQECICENGTGINGDYRWVLVDYAEVCVPLPSDTSDPGGGDSTSPGGGDNDGGGGSGGGPGFPDPGDYPPPGCPSPCPGDPYEEPLDPDGLPEMTAASYLISSFADLNANEMHFLNTHHEIANNFVSYLYTNNFSDDAKFFVEWGIGYLATRGEVSWNQFKNAFIDGNNYLANFSNLDNPVDFPQSPEILSPYVSLSDAALPPSSQQPKPVIGLTNNRDNTEDMQYGTNGDMTGILRDPINPNPTDIQLFTDMRELFWKTTILDAELANVATLMIDKFQSNSGGTFENTVLNNKVKNSIIFRNFVKKFGSELQSCGKTMEIFKVLSIARLTCELFVLYSTKFMTDPTGYRFS